MKRTVFPSLTLAMAAIVIAGCSEPTTTPGAFDLKPSFSASGGGDPTYVLTASASALRSGMAAEVAAAGGQVVAALDEVGIIIATSADPNFAGKAATISGIGNVVLDEVVQWVEPPRVTEEIANEAGVDAQAHGPTGVGTHETFRLVQWAPDAVSAQAAWDAGFQGAGARVAILDGGINRNHIDIAPNFDANASASFVPGQPYFFDTGNFWHGTHVAAIVGAPANNIGTVGIAPRATLIAVKVLHNGSGAFSWVMQGIVHAAKSIAEGGAAADIINMSLGAGFFRQGPAAAHLANALSRTTKFANQRGVTVIVAAGNAGVDIDHTANLIFVPAQSTGAIAISALGPVGWAVPGAVWSLDRPASYTNFGQSAIHLGAPGGDFVLPGTAICSKPRLPLGTGNVVQQCWVFDMVFSAFGAANNTYGWAAGTSMASPAAAGVAALIVGKARSLGIPISPAGVRTQLEKSSDDLGKPGNDDFYGAGRVNARRAVQ